MAITFTSPNTFNVNNATNVSSNGEPLTDIGTIAATQDGGETVRFALADSPLFRMDGNKLHFMLVQEPGEYTGTITAISPSESENQSITVTVV